MIKKLSYFFVMGSLLFVASMVLAKSSAGIGCTNINGVAYVASQTNPRVTCADYTGNPLCNKCIKYLKGRRFMSSATKSYCGISNVLKCAKPK